MLNALLGGLIIGFFVKGWMGVFVLPVFVAIFQCIEFFVKKRKSINVSEFTNPYTEAHYNLYTSSWEKFIDSIMIYIVHFFCGFLKLVNRTNGAVCH